MSVYKNTRRIALFVSIIMILMIILSFSFLLLNSFCHYHHGNVHEMQSCSVCVNMQEACRLLDKMGEGTTTFNIFEMSLFMMAIPFLVGMCRVENASSLISLKVRLNN